MKSILICVFLYITIISNLAFSQPQSFGKAIDFHNDYANTFNSPYLPTTNGTLEAWVKVRSISPPIGNAGEAFFAKNEEQWNIGDFYVFFEYSSGLLKSRIQAPPSLEIDTRSNSGFFPLLNYWIHYAFTWGEDGMKMYLNGQLQTSQHSLIYSALNNTYNIYVGAHGYMLHNGNYVINDYFDGQLDELRIWNYQKSSEQILQLWDAPLDSSYFASLDSGLVGYWRFDILEDLGINNDGVDDVRDLSVMQNHLDLTGAQLVSSEIIVPVELVSFTAELAGDNVNLKWETETELNNLGFEIERRTGNDSYRTIGFIEGQGTTTEPQNYSYTDDLFGLYTKLIYYRLKQIDFDGSYEYSDEIKLIINNESPVFELSQNYPNPFNPTTTIKYTIERDGFVSLVIYDVMGKEVDSLVNTLQNAGSYEIVFDGKNLASGIYYYKLKVGDFTAVKKLVLIK